MENIVNPAINQGEGIGDPYDQVVCPYDPAHIIQRYKLDTHLVKCAANNNKTKKKTVHTKVCPYDVKHIIPEEKFDHHVRICPRRDMLDNAMYNIDSSVENTAHEMRAPQVDASEDWENDEFNSYDPREQAARQPDLIRKIQGAPPSDRRAFRIQQRQLHRQNDQQ